MSNAVNYSKTQRIVLLIDLHPLLPPNPNPNPNYISSVISTCNLILSFPPLSSSLFSFKLFFSSLSPSSLHRLLPDHSSPSLSFNSPNQTLVSLSKTLTSLPSLNSPLSTNSPSTSSHTVASLIQLLRDNNHWDTDDMRKPSCNPIHLSSNFLILFSPVSRSLDSLAHFLSLPLNHDSSSISLDITCRARFRQCFRALNDAFNDKDIHFSWIDVCNPKNDEFEEKFAFVGDEVRKFGWGFCSADSIVLGSALVSFGLVYPNIAVSAKLVGSCGLDSNAIRGQLSLEILDVSGKPLECKFCDLELLRLKGSSKARFDDATRIREVGSLKGQNFNCVNKFLDSLNDGILKLHVTAVQKYTKYGNFEEFSSECFVVRSAESGKKGKDGLENLFADKVLELLAGENSVLFEKKTVPTWQIFLSFLYREGYWALLSLSNSNGDSYTGILKPFTIHSAILLVLDSNKHSVFQSSGGTNLLMNENFSQGDTDVQKGASPSWKYVHVCDGKRRKMKKHVYQDLTWSSFRKAAYEFLDVDLAELYFADGLKKSKKLKFLKCWMKEVKNDVLSLNKIPHGPCERGADSNQQKETNVNDSLTVSCGENDELTSIHNCSDQSRMQDGAALVSCSETVESFFSSLPKKIQHGLESDGVDLKILAERLVSSSIYWLRLKHEATEKLDESCTVQVAEIIKLLLREPKDLKEDRDDNPGSSSEYLVREYELQILLRLEILQSEYAGSMKGSVKMKLVKQICSLLEIFQYLVEGGLNGHVSLYDYVERTIKTRYSHKIGDVVEKIYDQMDLLPFGEEDEEQAFMFNSEDSNQSWREKHDRNDMSVSKRIQDSLSIEDESCHQLEKVNKSLECETKEDHVQKLNEARERRERARRFVSFTSRMPDLQRVWAPKQLKPTKVKHEPKSKKRSRVTYSVVCETPLTGNKASCSTQQNKGERSNPVSKALFQDDK